MTDNGIAYVREVERIVNHLHRERFRHLWTESTREGEWCGRFQSTQSFAFLFAVLHRFTGRSDYLRLSKRYLLDFDQGYHFGALFCGKAYELISGCLSPDERSTFAAAWVAGAQQEMGRVSSPVGGDPRKISAWNNVSNHKLCACVYADYARKLFPEEAEEYRFDRFTDAVWNVWWKRREFQEQTSNYEGFSEAFLCAWADLRGVSREFYTSPSIVNMFERNERVVAPSGIVAAYGDTCHNEHTTAWIALFEKIGRETGRGNWKQTAWEIFSYLKRRDLMKAAKATARKVSTENVYNGRMLFGQFIHAISWLAMAAVWSNPKLRPRPRINFAGTNARLPYGYVLRKADERRLPEGRLIASQVALVGGPAAGEGRTYLLLSVGPALDHDHSDAGSILMLSRGDALLLGTSGYFQGELAYHNTFYVQPARRAACPDMRPGRAKFGTRECAGTIQKLLTDRTGSYCRIFFERYHGEPVSLTREVAVDAGGGTTVIDRAVAHADGLCGGPVFHGEKIRQVATHAYSIRLNTLRSGCGVEFENAPGELLVELVCSASDVRVRRLGHSGIYATTPAYRRFPCMHYARIWRGCYTARTCLAVYRELKPEDETVFITRLIPGAARRS